MLLIVLDSYIFVGMVGMVGMVETPVSMHGIFDVLLAD